METLIAGISTILSAIAIPYIIQWAKSHPSIPLNADKTTVVRLVTAVLSLVVGIIHALLTNNLSSFNYDTGLSSIMDALMVFAASSGVYHIAIKEKDTPSVSDLVVEDHPCDEMTYPDIASNRPGVPSIE